MITIQHKAYKQDNHKKNQMKCNIYFDTIQYQANS